MRLFLFLGTLPFWIGCDGCRRSIGPDKDESTANTAAPAGEFTFADSRALPSTGSGGFSSVKPGHWFTLRQTLRANESDQRGDLSVSCNSATSPGGFGNAPGVSDVGMSGASTCNRPAVLPKGRMKRLDLRLLAPQDSYSVGSKVSTSGTLVGINGSSPVPRVDHLAMRASEYHFVVLTKRPERFASFQAADWVREPLNQDQASATAINYRLVFPVTNGLLGIPDTMMDWTSTAVVFWDDLSPSDLTAEQRQALTDWLHFGGRLIINGGPNVSELAQSEFRPWLPLDVDGMMDLEADDAAQLIESWAVREDNTTPSVVQLVRSQASRIAVRGPLTPDAIEIPSTAGLILSKQAGRGQVVFSRFDLTSDWLIGWRSRDSFFNAAVLGRPPRSYQLSPGTGDLLQTYVIDGRQPASLAMAGGALINTSLRIASRDLQLNTPIANPSNKEAADERDASSTAERMEFAADVVSGVGGWNPQSDVNQLLISQLRQDAGVKIPPLRFAVRTLAIYLSLLMLANFSLFWFLGRLEWAWIAVPLIGLAGAAWIANTVRLDLGFARSSTEIGLLEIQPGYSRAHLTRFTSLYNSLSGTYQIQFDNAGAAVSPYDADERASDMPATNLQYGYDAGLALASFSVPSNRTRIFHAEHMVDMGGDFRLQNEELINDSRYDLLGVSVLRRNSLDDYDIVSYDRVPAGSRRKVQWQAVGPPPLIESGVDGAAMKIANAQSMPLGSVRMIGTLEGTIAGMQIIPSINKTNAKTLVLCHLGHGSTIRSAGDLNLGPSKAERQKLLLNGDGNAGDGTVEVVP